MKIVITTLIIVAMNSCKAQEIDGLLGEYTMKSKEKNYSLSLLAGQKFSLEITSAPHSKSICNGTWESISSETIELRCHEQPVESQLSSAYMSRRQWTVKVVGKSRIRLGDEILKRK